MISPTSPLLLRLQACDNLSPGYTLSFVCNIVESTATQFLNKLALNDVQEDDGQTTDLLSACGRLRSFHQQCSDHSEYADIQEPCEEVYALLSPRVASLEVLQKCLGKVVSDSPGPYLKPFISGLAQQALLSRAVEAMESRESEMNLTKEVEDMSDKVNSFFTAFRDKEEMSVDEFIAIRKRVAELAKEVDMPAVRQLQKKCDRYAREAVLQPLSAESLQRSTCGAMMSELAVSAVPHWRSQTREAQRRNCLMI